MVFKIPSETGLNEEGFPRGEFSVVQYFVGGSYEYVRRYVTAEEAMKAVSHYTDSVAARIGVVPKVIITDGGDFVCFEWRYGEGVVFPPKEEIKDV